jgi:polyisoprenoid-binding protein YceI
MKQINIAAIAVFLFAACTDAPDAEKAATSEAKEASAATGQTLKLDTTASKIEWIGTKVSGYHTGTIKIRSGDLSVKDSTITAGSFVFDMKSIVVSGPPSVDSASSMKLQGHLRSADFFDVEKYPEGSFVITEVKPFTGTVKDSADARQETISKYKVANPTHMVSGNLTIKGITKNIEFPAQITISGNSVEAIAKFNIDRTQWNIVYPGKPDDLVRNEIHLGIALKASK